MLYKYKSHLGKLSRVGKFDIDLDLKGKHLELLTKSNKMNQERTVLSVLKDLAPDIDVYQLTKTELFHVFLLVKANSISTNLTFNVVCPHKITASVKGSMVTRDCGCTNEASYNFTDSDVVECPADFEIPTINIGGKDYTIRPLTMDTELKLIDMFVENGVPYEELLNPDNSVDFTLSKLVCHLCDQNGDFHFEPEFIKNTLELLKESSVKVVKELTDKVSLVSGFGVKNKVITLVCKGCGGTFRTMLGLKSGLSV